MWAQILKVLCTIVGGGSPLARDGKWPSGAHVLCVDIGRVTLVTTPNRNAQYAFVYITVAYCLLPGVK